MTSLSRHDPTSVATATGGAAQNCWGMKAHHEESLLAEARS